MELKVYESNNGKRYISTYDAYKLGLIDPKTQMTEINSDLYEINLIQLLQLKDKKNLILKTYPVKFNNRIDKLQQNQEDKEDIVVIKAGDLIFLYPSTAKNLGLIDDLEYEHLRNQLYLLDINLFHYINQKFNIEYINMPTENIGEDKIR